MSDFGLAKRLRDERAAITVPSSALGSPSYMAPEQSTGQSTIASDVWSLGAILYEMLTGEPPFRGKTPLETLRKAIDEAPVPPRRKNPVVSRDLETICLKCLEKDESVGILEKIGNLPADDTWAEAIRNVLGMP